MPTNISWSLNVQIPSGPLVNLASEVEVDAYDRVTVSIPHSTATPPAEVEVDVQPGAAGRVRFLLVQSSAYGDDLKYKIHATGEPERVLNQPLLLVGEGALELLGADLDKILVANAVGHAVTIDILVGRQAMA